MWEKPDELIEPIMSMDMEREMWNDVVLMIVYHLDWIVKIGVE